VYDTAKRRKSASTSLIHRRRRGAGRDQFQPRRSRVARGSDVSVQALPCGRRRCGMIFTPTLHGQALRAGTRLGPMHIHQSVVDARRGKSLFQTKSGQGHARVPRPYRRIATALPAAMPLIAPFVNSYRRLVRFLSAPINTALGHETSYRRPARGRCGRTEPAHRKHGVPGADANPYLAIAASLVCGYLG